MEKNIEGLPEFIRTSYEYRFHDPTTLSPLTLAFIGDTVFDLIVRTRSVQSGNAPVNKLHKRCSSLVNATTQATMMCELMSLSTKEEEVIFRRGRNAKSYTSAKNVNIKAYSTATGLEVPLDWLYLHGTCSCSTSLCLPPPLTSSHIPKST